EQQRARARLRNSPRSSPRNGRNGRQSPPVQLSSRNEARDENEVYDNGLAGSPGASGGRNSRARRHHGARGGLQGGEGAAERGGAWRFHRPRRVSARPGRPQSQD